MSSSFLRALDWGLNKQHAASAEKELLPKTQEETELEDIAENGMSAHGKWGLRFSRSAEGQTDEHKSKSCVEKKLFRQDWAKCKLESVRRKKTRSESWTKVDTQKGTYVPFVVLWQREGGRDDPSALSCAVKYARKCVAMGPPWTSYNGMTERCEFLHLVREVSETFTKCWSLCEEEMQSDQPNV